MSTRRTIATITIDLVAGQYAAEVETQRYIYACDRSDTLLVSLELARQFLLQDLAASAERIQLAGTAPVSEVP